MRQRRAANAFANAGLVATVSDRALIMRAPPEASFDHEGTSPQRGVTSLRTTASDALSMRSTTAATGSVGAVFHVGDGASTTSSIAKVSTISSVLAEAAKRPHIMTPQVVKAWTATTTEPSSAVTRT